MFVIFAENYEWKDQLNDLLNKFIVDIGEFPEDYDKDLEFVHIFENVCFVSPFSELFGDKLKAFLETFLKSIDNVKIRRLTDDEQVKYREYLPQQTSSGDLFGPNYMINIDTKNKIDKNVKPLCDAINLICGMKTISSCEGHNRCVLYVIFYSSSYDLYVFDQLMSEAMNKCGHTQMNYIISVSHDRKHFGNLNYCIQIENRGLSYSTFCKYVKDISEHIMLEYRKSYESGRFNFINADKIYI
jgi:hypothetical protein